MSDRVVVLGAGYAGARAVQRLARTAPPGVDIEWISAAPYHTVAHELHRLVRRPGAKSALQIPITAVCPDRVQFEPGWVEAIDSDARHVELADGAEVEYDYLLVALGSKVAYYGIPGAEEHAYTLKDIDDVLAINDQLAAATTERPGRVVIGGGGLTGIQTAGEVAAYGAETGRSFEITLIEGSDAIYPGNSTRIQQALADRLERRGVDIITGKRVTQVSGSAVELDDGRTIPHDLPIWAGGVTGREPVAEMSLTTRQGRLVTDQYFQTDDERVFAAGDIEVTTEDGPPIPPTAQAAWQTAPTAAVNLVRAMGDEPLTAASYTDRGTAISIGDAALVHDVPFLPIDPLTGPPAVLIKKGIAARMIASLASLGHAKRAWQYL